MRNSPLIPHDLAATRLEDALRLRVGRGKRYSFSALSDASGVPTRTLESYVQGATPSGLSTFLSIAAVLGPSFTSDILEACGQSASEMTTDQPEHMRAVGVMGALIQSVSEAVADGHVDHVEAARLRPMAAELIEILTPIAASGGVSVVSPRGNQ